MSTSMKLGRIFWRGLDSKALIAVKEMACEISESYRCTGLSMMLLCLDIACALGS